MHVTTATVNALEEPSPPSLRGRITGNLLSLLQGPPDKTPKFTDPATAAPRPGVERRGVAQFVGKMEKVTTLILVLDYGRRHSEAVRYCVGETSQKRALDTGLKH
eukprot:3839439-Pyramimonas_sp.AAC.1